MAAGRHRGVGGRLFASPSVRLVGKRLLMAVPITLGVSILTFWVLNLIPGNAAQQLLGADATPEQIRAMELQLGLDKPAPLRYLDWLGGAVTGDLGRSLVSGQSVAGQLGERLAVTGELVAMAFVVSLLLAVPVALLAAYHPNRFFDRLSMFVSVTGLSVANYVLALVLVLVFAVRFAVFPAIGFVPLSESVGGNLHSLVLPSAAIGIPMFCLYTRFLRGDLVDQMQGQDYVVTAQAKGVGPWQVLLRHAFRNSSFGLITVVGLNLSTLIGATVIIEQIFALPGLGQLMLQAINTRDMAVVQACVVVFAVVAVLANLLTDLLYAVLDPRIRYGSR
ncbi:ABC transporter permease [Microtetraspora malaysiensis]|uniref:ABC transporter permease n=1 Tax=Microtetraspora malaysiensis TaxID=161358 RepID=UPI001C3F15D7|nr:ABC transporter permease [Microtetraspora malaysiensis]